MLYIYKYINIIYNIYNILLKSQFNFECNGMLYVNTVYGVISSSRPMVSHHPNFYSLRLSLWSGIFEWWPARPTKRQLHQWWQAVRQPGCRRTSGISKWCWWPPSATHSSPGSFGRQRACWDWSKQQAAQASRLQLQGGCQPFWLDFSASLPLSLPDWRANKRLFTKPVFF